MLGCCSAMLRLIFFYNIPHLGCRGYTILLLRMLQLSHELANFVVYILELQSFVAWAASGTLKVDVKQ